MIIIFNLGFYYEKMLLFSFTSPKILNKIEDDELQKFASDLNAIWKRLGKRVSGLLFYAEEFLRKISPGSVIFITITLELRLILQNI